MICSLPLIGLFLLEQHLKMFHIYYDIWRFGGKKEQYFVGFFWKLCPLGNSIHIVHDFLALASISLQQFQDLPLNSNAI